MKKLLTFILAMNLLQVASAAKEIHVIVHDVVSKIETEGRHENVYFKKYAGLYSLPRDSKNYQELKTFLLESIKSGKKVKLKADPTTLEIKEIIP